MKKQRNASIIAFGCVFLLFVLSNGTATPIDYLPTPCPTTQPYADSMSLKLEIEELKLEIMRMQLDISVQDMKINMLNALIDRMSKPPDVSVKPYRT